MAYECPVFSQQWSGSASTAIVISTYGTAGMSTIILNFLPLSAADRIRWASAMPDVSDVTE